MIISLDLDGTLLNSNKEVPKTTIEYLKKLKDRGEIIVLNSGRSLDSVLNATKLATFANFIIGDTGAIIYDVKDKRIIEVKGIDLYLGEEIFKLVKNQCTEFSIFTSGKTYYKYYNLQKAKEDNCIEILDYNYIVNNNVNITHMSFDLKSQEWVDKLAEKLQSKFKQLNIFSMIDSFGTEKWIEIINKEAGKFNSVLCLANMLGINQNNIISFGDAINDLEMIKNSGIGVAMKNAVPKLKENAKYTTEFDNNNLGVEKWLRKYYNE